MIQQDENPRKKLYSALVSSSTNEKVRNNIKKMSFQTFDKNLDDDKFVDNLFFDLSANKVVIDPKNRQANENIFDFIDTYVKVPAAKAAAPVAKPAAAPVAAPVAEKAKPVEANGKNYAFVGQPQTGEMDAMVVDGKSIGVPQGMTMVPEGEETPEVEYEGKMLPEVTATPAPYQFPERGTEGWDAIYNSNPKMGTPEYDYRIAMLNQPPKLVLGGGGYTQEMAAGLPETKEKAKQYSLSPVFKDYEVAQKMMKGEVPLVTQKDVREAKENWNKMTKEQQQAAIMGSSGSKLAQKYADEKRTATEKLADFGYAIGATFDNLYDKVLAAEALIGAKQKRLFKFGKENEKAKEEEKVLKGKIVKWLDGVDKKYARRMYEANIQGNVYDALEKGEIDKLPEAIGFNIAQIAMQALAAAKTGGYSMFAQMMPEMYKAGVEEVARKTNKSVDDVIKNGEDSEVVAYIAALGSGYVETVSAGILGQAMKSKGAYKFIRDMALKKLGKSNLARAVATGTAVAGVGTIEGGVEAGQKLIEVAQRQAAAAKSPQEAIENTINELRKKGVRKEVVAEFVNAFFGTAGLAGGAQFGQSVMDRTLFETPKISKATQRADYDVVQTDNKITERNKIAQAMESAVQANPEAEGQIRQQYQKRINEAAPTDQEVLSAYESLSTLAESEEKDAIRENLERYMEERGIQAPPTGIDAGLGELMRREPSVVRTVNPEFPPPQATIDTAPATEAAVYDIERIKQIEGMLASDAQSMAETGQGKLIPEARIELQNELASLKDAAPKAPAVSDAEMDANIEEGQRRSGFVYESPLESLTQDARGIIQNVSRNRYMSMAPVRELFAELYDAYRIFAKQKNATSRNLTTAQIDEGIADFEETLGLLGDYISKRDSGEFVREYTGRKQQEEQAAAEEEAAALAEEVPATEVPISTEEEVSPQEELPEDLAAFGQRIANLEQPQLTTPVETTPVAPAEEEVVTEEVPAEEVAVEEAAPVAPAAPAKEVGVGGIIRGHQDIVGNEGAGDVRDKLPYADDSGTVVVEGNDGNQYAVAFSRRGGDRQRIFEQGGSTPRPGHIYTSVKIDDPSNAQEVEAAKKQAEAALAEILPTVKGGNIRASAVQQAITDFQTKKPAEVAPAPKAKKAPAPKAETKQEAPKTEAKPVSTTPQEGATVEIPAQRAEFGTRKMVFKEGEWKQNVGGDILKVGPSVQQQAQEAFAGKEETKPAETKKETAPKEEGKKPAPKEEKVTPKLKDYKIKPPSDNVSEVAQSSGLTAGKKNTTKPISELSGGVDLKQEKERRRVDKLKEEITSEGGYISRLIVNKDGEVIEGQHRLEALRELGFTEVPVVELLGPDDFISDVIGLRKAIEDAGLKSVTSQNELVDNITEILVDEKGDVSQLEFYEAPKGYEKPWFAAVKFLTQQQPSTPSTKELASQVEDMRSLPPAKRKAAQQALEERYGKEDVAKMIEITANFTKIIDDLEKRGVVKIDCP